MKTVYETLDGKHFGEIADAEKHEAQLLKQVKMWDWAKEPTTNTAQARVVHLMGESAGAAFKTMVQANSEETVSIEQMDEWFDDEDTGWFYWDEYTEIYRYIDSEIVDVIIAANHQI